MRPTTLHALACACCLLPQLAAGAECVAASGPTANALVELYTSEGCSSCPPADRQLSRLGGDGVVPLGLHVDYWDYLGWADTFARPEFAARQRWLAGSGGAGAVYTPQFFISGHEARGWDGGLDHELKRVHALPARAKIRTSAASAGPGRIEITATADSTDAAADHAGLFLALTQDGLMSRVTAGENQATILHHDNVVRLWLGPVALRNGKATLHQTLPLAPDWTAGHLRVAAFVQDERTGDVLQAVASPPCVGTE